MQTSNAAYETPFLFKEVIPFSACDRCFDTGLWRKPSGEIDICPNIMMNNHNDEPNPSAFVLRRAVERLKGMNVFINSYPFELARILTHYSSENPCRREDLCDFFFATTNFTNAEQNRKIAKMVEELRKIWLLPVGSRKEEPSGYWIITELADYKLWVERAKAAPITQLSTIHKNARHNFPHFAEQMEIEFWSDISRCDEEAD